jgi:hypothetical protein
MFFYLKESLILRIQMTNLETENYLRSFVYNARVLLVGGAEFTEHEAQLFSSKDFDVVARVNNHYTDQGGLVDVLYTAGSQEPESELEDCIIIQCSPLPDEEESSWSNLGYRNRNRFLRFDTNCYQGSNPFGPENEFINLLYKEFKSMPFTGMIAVNHLLMMPIKSLTLIGFDFYQRAGILPSHRDSHGVWQQVIWLFGRFIRDCRLQLSDQLVALMEKTASAHDYRAAKEKPFEPDTESC